MKAILQTKIRLFIRKPWLFLIMTVLCVIFAIFVGKGTKPIIEIPVFSEMNEEDTAIVMEKLKESKSFRFDLLTENEVEKQVSEGKVEAGIVLKEDDFTILTAANTPNLTLIQQYVSDVYSEYVQNEQLIAKFTNKEAVKQALQASKENPAFTIEKKNFTNDETVIIDTQLQGLFGFSLFFAIYTIAYTVVSILEEKEAGIWNRIVLSSVKKWEMYVANLLYSFVLGYIQIVLIFCMFKFGAGVDFHGAFLRVLLLLIPYVFAIVAMSVMITGFVKNSRHFQAMIPLVSVSMAMIGGAFWPIEIVSSDIMVTLSKFVPITYGMELLKGATIYGLSFTDMLYPIAVLTFMGVVMMGVGINVMEKKYSS
ncbi:ABC transporter permease [Bacillus sp. FJAT-47783]|uniref:ABC transporter permease n=1 Tax=Bacillus sp. FJAT-47783 TaxID=2922712 RepID=UPI001FACA8FA|nr:ABC transporter permease [Bacillus sp. FJAT-47783]